MFSFAGLGLGSLHKAPVSICQFHQIDQCALRKSCSVFFWTKLEAQNLSFQDFKKRKLEAQILSFQTFPNLKLKFGSSNLELPGSWNLSFSESQGVM